MNLTFTISAGPVFNLSDESDMLHSVKFSLLSMQTLEPCRAWPDADFDAANGIAVKEIALAFPPHQWHLSLRRL